jgi:hypothetical protein
MIYNLTVHYHYDPDDEQGYDDEIEAENIDAAIEKVKQIEDFNDFNYYVLESEDGNEYYNSSEEEGFEDY